MTAPTLKKNGLLLRAQAAPLIDLLRRTHHCAASSEWTTGSGRHTRKRPIPPLCALYWTHEAAPAHVEAFRAARPRVKYIIAVIDPDAARQFLTLHG